MSDCKPVVSSAPCPRRATVGSSPYVSISSSMPRSNDFHPYPQPIPRRRSTIHDNGHDVDGSRPPPPSSIVQHHSHPGTPSLSWSSQSGSTNSPDFFPTLRSPEESDIYFNSPFSMAAGLPSTSGSSGLDQPRITPALVEFDGLLESAHLPPPPSTVSSPDPTYYGDPAFSHEALLKRVRDLEFAIGVYRGRAEEAWGRMQELQGLVTYHPNPHTPNPSLGPPPSDWPSRTKARIRRFCTLNRAGNALCAWHDSRRERRMYPPRNAPNNTLNCGCTYEQALFEESLARHQVGSYLPGESVRMDPALRNSLLRLLEDTYGYRDGDFERLPDGTWRQGEDAASWEQKATLKPPRRDR